MNTFASSLQAKFPQHIALLKLLDKLWQQLRFSHQSREMFMPHINVPFLVDINSRYTKDITYVMDYLKAYVMQFIPEHLLIAPLGESTISEPIKNRFGWHSLKFFFLLIVAPRRLRRA